MRVTRDKRMSTQMGPGTEQLAPFPLPANNRPGDSRTPLVLRGGGCQASLGAHTAPPITCTQQPIPNYANMPGCLLSKRTAILSAICMYFKLTCSRQRSRFMNLITFIDSQNVSAGRDVRDQPAQPLVGRRRRRPRAAGSSVSKVVLLGRSRAGPGPSASETQCSLQTLMPPLG